MWLKSHVGATFICGKGGTRGLVQGVSFFVFLGCPPRSCQQVGCTPVCRARPSLSPGLGLHQSLLLRAIPVRAPSAARLCLGLSEYFLFPSPRTQSLRAGSAWEEAWHRAGPITCCKLSE